MSDEPIPHVPQRAIEVFGDRQIAISWLLTPNRALGGKRPADLLHTNEGREQVETILARIEYGVYS